MICPCDYDAPAVYQAVKRKARKEHRCCECRGVIRKGETYEHVSGLWEGRWSRYRTCADCLHLHCQTGCECRLLGGLHEQVLEDDNPRLIGLMRAIVHERREGAAA